MITKGKNDNGDLIVLDEVSSSDQADEAGDGTKVSEKIDLYEKKGNLMRSGVSLAHCVSKDLKMFKGLAKSFRDEWPGQIYQLKKMDLQVGDVGAIKVKERFIYHLITKEWCNDQPTYDNLRKSLNNMKEHMVENDIAEVSLPKIGCGMNRLSWPVVKMMIEEVFDDTGIKINIIYRD